jgi:hypothetical protein
MKLDSAKLDAAAAKLDAAGREYTATAFGKKGNELFTSRPYSTREEAAAAAFAAQPNAQKVSTGYGYKGSFDIRWHNR